MSRIRTTEYYHEIAEGRVDGETPVLILGNTYYLQETKSTTIADLKTGDSVLYKHLSASGETLFVSSSSVSDTDVDVIVSGVDANGDVLVGTANMNGQNPVEVVNILGGGAVAFRFVNASVIPNDTANNPVGDVYIAVSTALTLGVPDATEDIKARIPLSRLAGDIGTRVANQHISHNALYYVPNGFRLLILDISGQTEKDESSFLAGIFSIDGGPFLQRNPLPVYQDEFKADFKQPVKLEAHTIVEFIGYAKPGSLGAFATITVEAVLVSNMIVPNSFEFEAMRLP